jgi:spermidine/putrescine transport system substrate-binding protein
MSDTYEVVSRSNWPSYLDVNSTTKTDPTLTAFTKKRGIKVSGAEDNNDNDEFITKVRQLLAAGSDTRPNTWVSTDWMVARLIREDFVPEV